ncbi:hypothetical protein SCHIN_v1c05760 [Spiroplasma chinense]|uniref:ABC transporter permease n=1 Tax=Spiroplasma chinense TaxID=216932 RepID=A0A5B9Y4S0_9MOLU|nr:hypothetical protein [Spiroplasma chinense]QEH61773.1 hypothetical protein SCHIN_v1c05760 [Spiroplasma chinense]
MKILKLISSYFKIHWKITISIVIFWLLIMTMLFIMPLFYDFFVIAEGETMLFTIKGAGTGSTGSVYITLRMSMLYDYLFSGIGIAFYALLQLFL